MCEIVTFLYNLYDPYKWIHSYTIGPLNIMLISVHVAISLHLVSTFYLSKFFSNANRGRFNTQGVPAFGLIMPLECAIYITRHVSFQISSDCSNT